MHIATTKLKSVKCYNKAQTVITTSIPLVTNYGIAVSMTLKSEDKKKKVNSDVVQPI